MKLYYAAGASSLASRIMLHEAGLDAAFERVDLGTKVTETGADFRTINPAGCVPALLLDDGQVLTENLAVLFWISGLAPQLAPEAPFGTIRLLEALAVIATEVHKPLRPFFTPAASDAEKARAAVAISARLKLITGVLAGPHLFGSRFTAADAYLFVTLWWVRHFGVAVPPALTAFCARIMERSHVRAALAEEALSEKPVGRRLG
jgi:glutathione S-transferase